jgi:hypothetical protein
VRVSIPEQPLGNRPNADESIPVHDPGEPRGQAPAGAGNPVDGAKTPEAVQTQVVVRRSPRYSHFMILGAILGAVAALILTFAFPANPTYDRGQVFGYLLLVGIAVGVGLGALVALILDRIVGRKGTSVIADWVETTPNDETGARKDGDA